MIRHQKGHKNSKGEKAEWVIISHKDGHVISSHTSKEAAQKHLKDIQKFKHMKESIEYTEDSIYDRLVGYGFDPGDLNEYFKYHPIEDYVRAISIGKMSFPALIRKIEIWMGWETEELEEAAEDGHISRWDRNKIFKGIAPSWAKKVTTIGSKAKRPDTANIPSELAMRRVTEPNYRKYTELDLRNDKEADKIANQRIADMIARKVDLPMAVTADSIIIHGDDTSFEVIPYGFVYKIRVRKGLEKEIVDFESISEVIEFIKKETLGESMKLTEAKQILKNAGYLVEDTDDWDEADMPAGTTATQRKKMVTDHNAAHKNIDDKFTEGNIWVIKVIYIAKDEEEGEYDDDLGWLTPDFEVVEDVNDAMMNYDQCDLIFQKYIDFWEKPKGKLKQALKDQCGNLEIYLQPGTYKNGKFYFRNIDNNAARPEDI